MTSLLLLSERSDAEIQQAANGPSDRVLAIRHKMVYEAFCTQFNFQTEAMLAKSTVPTSIPEFLMFAGTGIYGPTCWRGRLAAGLGVSRSTLRLWLAGQWKSDRDIDGEILALIDRERDGHLSRGVELTALRNAILAAGRRNSNVAA